MTPRQELNRKTLKEVDLCGHRPIRPSWRIQILFFSAILAAFFSRAAGSSDEDYGALTGILDHAEVLSLNDDDFERRTQVSTGATTGDWFVKFNGDSCGDTCAVESEAWQEIAGSFSGAVNVAEVDIGKNPELLKRFKFKSLPTLVYFSNGWMRFFDGKRYAVEELRTFVTRSRRRNRDEHEWVVVPDPIPWYENIRISDTPVLYASTASLIVAVIALLVRSNLKRDKSNKNE